MSEATPDTHTAYRIARNPQQEPHPHSAGHTAGTSTRPPRPKRSHHRGSKPSRRPPMSQAQRQKLSAAQKAYVANDPRWLEHCRKLAAAQEAKRMTLMENEVAAIVAMREQGRNFSYVAEKIGVCRDVIGRELNALGISTAPAKSDRRMTLMENEVAAIVAMRKRGRSFEYIAEEIGVCREVIKRELTALGISTAPVKADRRARRGRGFWRSFDD
jgi:DNA-binding phage protein